MHGVLIARKLNARSISETDWSDMCVSKKYARQDLENRYFSYRYLPLCCLVHAYVFVKNLLFVRYFHIRLEVYMHMIQILFYENGISPLIFHIL